MLLGSHYWLTTPRDMRADQHRPGAAISSIDAATTNVLASMVTCLEAAWLALTAAGRIKTDLPELSDSDTDDPARIWSYISALLSILCLSDSLEGCAAYVGLKFKVKSGPEDCRYSSATWQQRHWAVAVLDRLGLSPKAAEAAYGHRPLPFWMRDDGEGYSIRQRGLAFAATWAAADELCRWKRTPVLVSSERQRGRLSPAASVTPPHEEPSKSELFYSSDSSRGFTLSDEGSHRRLTISHESHQISSHLRLSPLAEANGSARIVTMSGRASSSIVSSSAPINAFPVSSMRRTSAGEDGVRS